MTVTIYRDEIGYCVQVQNGTTNTRVYYTTSEQAQAAFVAACQNTH